MSQRRGHGEGTIYKRKSDGRWVAEITLGRQHGGKRRKKIIYRKTRKAAQEALIKNLSDMQQGLPIDSAKQTLATFLLSWLENTVKGSRAVNTYKSYANTVHKHIIPVLGDLQLSKLQPQQLQYLYRMKREEGLTRTVQLIHAVLHNALALAVKWELIPRNIVEVVDTPKVPRKEIKVLTFEEVNRFLKTAQDDPFYALYVVAVTSGLRQGELFALKWSDLNREAGTIQVQRQLQWVRGEAQFREPKSAKSRRTVTLPEVAIEALRKHKVEQAKQRLVAGAKWHDLGLIFTSSLGTPLHRSNLLQRYFYPMLEKAGVPRIRFHDLRHTAATLLLEQGIHPKIVQERLGHSQISMTLDTYSHVLPTMQQEVAEKLDAILDLA